MTTFKQYYNKNRAHIPNVIFVLAWNIMSASYDLFGDQSFFCSSSYVSSIHQLMENLDEHYMFSFQSKFDRLLRVLRRFQAHILFCFLRHDKINLNDCIKKINTVFSDYLIVRNKIQYPKFSLWNELDRYIDSLCKESAHQLYTRHCALFIYTHMYRYHTKFMKNQELVVKNKKDNQPDRIMTVYYHSLFNDFWPHALSSGFSGSFENNRYVVYTNRENTSQEAVSLVCMYSKNRVHGLKYIENEFFRLSEMDYVTFEQWVQKLCVISDKWFYNSILDLISNFFVKYIEDTLGSSWLRSCVRKIELFVTKNPNMAQYIWETNYNTEKHRINFAIKANIGKKYFNGFIKAQTIGELKQYLDKRLKTNKTVYDDLPLHMKNKIRDAEYNVLSARRGSRVGWTGIYISSDQINQAENILHNLWKEADKYISKKKLTI